MILGTVFSTVGGIVTTWLQGKQKIQEATIEQQVKSLERDANWDELQAGASATSWKDEWLTLLISIPLVMAFIPELASFVDVGFDVLERTPEWYQMMVGVVFAASFGLKEAVKFMQKKP